MDSFSNISVSGSCTCQSASSAFCSAGAALFAAGIAIAALWAIPFGISLLQQNTVAASTTIGAGQSVNARTDVVLLDRPVSLVIAVDNPGQGTPSEVRLKAVVTDPSGKVVSSSEFSDSYFTSFTLEATGPHMVGVTNLGTKPVTISGTFGKYGFAFYTKYGYPLSESAAKFIEKKLKDLGFEIIHPCSSAIVVRQESAVKVGDSILKQGDRRAIRSSWKGAWHAFT